MFGIWRLVQDMHLQHYALHNLATLNNKIYDIIYCTATGVKKKKKKTKNKWLD